MGGCAGCSVAAVFAAQYWDMPVSGQTAGTAPARVMEFLGSVARQ